MDTTEAIKILESNSGIDRTTPHWEAVRALIEDARRANGALSDAWEQGVQDHRDAQDGLDPLVNPYS